MAGGTRGRLPCCDKSKVKRGPWSHSEDVRLVSFIQKHGHPNWRSLPKQAGLLRCGKSCRLRWINYLRPDVKRGNFTPQEENSIIRLHATFGNKWSKIAAQLPGRTDNEIKNVWNTHLKKRQLIDNNIDSSKNKDIVCSQQQQAKVIEATTSAISIVEDIIDHDSSSPSSMISCISSQDKAYCSDTPSCHDEANNNNLEIPSEVEPEFWNNMLDDIQLQPQPQLNSTTDDDGSLTGQEMDIEYWMRLLEEELGLVGPTDSSQQVDQAKMIKDVSEMWCKLSDQISPLWPTSPQNIGFY